MNNPEEMIIISTWESKEDWDSWHSSSVRKDYYKKLRFLLESEEEISFYSVAARK
jgi:heme-degrading monooxygenase HmoA